MDNFDLRKFLAEGKLHEAMSPQDVVDIADTVAEEFTKESAEEGDFMVYSVGEMDAADMSFELDTDVSAQTPERILNMSNLGVGEGWGGSFRISPKEEGYEVRNAEKGGLVAIIDNMGNFRMLSADESRAEMGRAKGEETDFIERRRETDDYMEEGFMDKVEDFLSTAGQGVDNPTRPGLGEETKSNKMKKSELKEMIKAAMLAEAEDEDVEEGVRYNDATRSYEKTDDEEGLFGLDPKRRKSSLREKDEEVADDIELEDEADVDVDVDVDMDAGEGGIDVKQDADSDLSGTVGDVQDNLEAALEAARRLGDEKLEDQIGNTLTFFTRSHVVKEGNKMDLEESASSDLELKSYAKKLIPLIKQLGFDVVYSTDGEWKKNLGDLKPGAKIVYISIEKGDLIISIPKSAGLSKAQEILKKVNSDLGDEFDAKISEGKIGQTSLYMIKMTLK